MAFIVWTILLFTVSTAMGQSGEASVSSPDGQTLVLEGEEINVNLNSGRKFTASDIFDLMETVKGLQETVDNLESKLGIVNASLESANVEISILKSQLKAEVVNSDGNYSSIDSKIKKNTEYDEKLHTQIDTLNMSTNKKISNVEQKLEDLDDEVHELTNMVFGSSLSPNATVAAGWEYPVLSPVRVPFVDGSMIWAANFKETVHEPTNSDCYATASGEYSHRTHKISVSPMKSYEVRIWIKSTGEDMRNYFGFFAWDENDDLIKGSSGEYTNPYFKTSKGDGEWHLQTIRLLSSDTAMGSTTIVESTGIAEWKLPTNVAYIRLRFLSCYADGDGKSESFFALPSMNELWSDVAHVSPKQHQIVGRWGVAGTYNIVRNVKALQYVPASKMLYFDKKQYTSLLANTQELFTRVCFSYSDDTTAASSERPELLLRFQRISNPTYPQYGSQAGPDGVTYEAGHIFWSGSFRHTWSDNIVYHHTCGEWFPSANISCGSSFGNTCYFTISAETDHVVTVQGIDMELAAFPRKV
eukprot:m.3475 g.3475  ORF g.3475 m.3475 type:complete len:528 (+) comp2776_c0_seq1:22-1605(+)